MLQSVWNVALLSQFKNDIDTFNKNKEQRICMKLRITIYYPPFCDGYFSQPEPSETHFMCNKAGWCSDNAPNLHAFRN